MRTVFIAALTLGAVGFVQGQSAPPKEQMSIKATMIATQQDDGTVRLTNMSISFPGATLTAEDATWHKASNEIELRGKAWLKLDRVRLQLAPPK
jgi:hypothetical protein